ncbi:MAG: phosphoribosyltransferase [Saprospiraceae bacterium]|jgi:pyrimidine operon attenuation protein/uracil phosphoribosyltransferase|nr:phosphoribosyltransferase [Saprospiraceae bacterium]
MELLNHRQVIQKIKRLAIEILENNDGEQELIFAGINNNGYVFAEILVQELRPLAKMPLKLTRIRLNPAQPLHSPIQLELPVAEFEGKTIIIVDDVANTGRTIFYACKPLMEVLPRKVEVVVLVDRKHKSFPIKVDYVGLSLATTLQEDIDVQIKITGSYAVFLK